MRALACLGLLLLVQPLTGCRDGSDAVVSATVAPDAITFGEVPVGELQFRDVQVTNPGILTLQILSARIIEDGTPFESATSLLEVRPGESATLAVSFRAQVRGEYAATLEIETNAESPLYTVPVSATAITGAVSISQESVDFGGAATGCGREETVSIINTGNATLSDLSVLTRGASGLSVEGVTSPFELAVGGSVEVTLRWSGLPGGPMSGELAVQQGGLDAAAIPVSGQAQDLATTETSVASIPTFPLVDFMFVVDTATDMGTVQNRMRNSSLLLVTEGLEDTAIDWQVAVVSADADASGVLLAPIVNAGTPNAANVIGEAFVQANSVTPGYGLQSAWDTLGAVTSARRPGAGLSLTFASTLDDQSGAPPAGFATWLDAFIDEAGDPTLLTVSNISGGAAGCGSGSVTGAPSPNLEAVGWRGQDVEVCASNIPLWPIAYAGPNLPSTFPLSPDPVPSSVTVTAATGEGEPQLADGWAWDPVLGAVVFADGELPQPGTNLVFRWLPASVCE